MRWKMPNREDVRYVRRFLIFPKVLWNNRTIEPYREYRWLECVYVHQIYDEKKGWRSYAWADWKKDLRTIKVKS